MRLLIHDFAGHPFSADLARALARRRHSVTHAYCGGVTSGHGALTTGASDDSGLRFLEVSSEPFERYSPVARVRSELTYGRKLARLVPKLRPEVILSANTPLASQAHLWRAGRRVRARRIYWLQDFLGSGTRAVLHGRSPILGHTFGRGWERLEHSLLRRSDAIIAISSDFVDQLKRSGVATPIRVVENWTPLHEVTPRPKANPWSASHGLAERPVALYSGTLGLKHDPELLVSSARQLSASGGLVAVISEGLGRDYLERRRADLGLENLRLLDYVEYEELPLALGAADVCLALLEPAAGTFSVPSKILSYLAAGRAIVGAIPEENLASRTIARARAGVVVPAGDHQSFARAIDALLRDDDRSRAMGAAGRRYAEEAFDIEQIADKVEATFML